MQTVTPTQLKEILQRHSRDEVVIDVRTTGEYHHEHIPGVKNVPISEMPAHLADLKHYDKLYLYCGTGGRSEHACQKLAELGLPNAVNVEGGIEGWKQLGWPTAHVGHSISIMRQVRLVAGSLVIISWLLSVLIHPAWIYLGLAIGSGLVFSGVTDTCALAIILAKMPWNR